LRDRLKNDNSLVDVESASSFANETVANRALGKFVKDYKSEIETFLKDTNKKKLEVVFDFGEQAGTGVERGKSGVWQSNKVYVFLTKDTSDSGWHFVTSFPILGKEMTK
jgi:Bacterial CdiA-CT RNAse A domain